MFPAVDLAALEATVASAFGTIGTEATWTLYDADSDAVDITVRVATGSLRPEDLTAGMTQNGLRVRVPSSAWDAISPGRPPRKGDTVVIDGRRHGIQAVHTRGLGDQRLMYVCVALG